LSRLRFANRRGNCGNIALKSMAMIQFLILVIALFGAGELRAQTGLLFDDVYLKHISGNTGHPERPERLTAIRDGLAKAGLLNDLVRISPRRSEEHTSEL